MLKPENTTFDLVVGANAKTDTIFICTVPADQKQGREHEIIQVQPSVSLRDILEPFTEVCQITQFGSAQNFVILTHCEPMETYFLLLVQL